MGQLDDKVAFVTGAARGQGRSHAVRMAEEGADIIAVDICDQVDTVPYSTASKEDLDETVRQVESLGRRIIAAHVDVRDSAALTKTVDDGVAELGRLDIVIANAGISSPAETATMSDEIWDTMIDINLSGQFRTVRPALRHLIDGGRGGSIVLTSSLATMKANPNMAHYTAAKAGLVGLMQVLALELAPHSIRVNTVHPGTVFTDMVLNDSTFELFRPDLEHPGFAEFEEAARTLHKMPTAGVESADITDAIMYLVTDTGKWVTGTTHVVDAGGHL
jgi:(+)-trans-carveol dehydrogenase